MPDFFKIDALDAFYGDFQALYGVSLHVDPSEVIAIIGATGRENRR